ncbi:protein tyrosine phosphatase-like protein [Encephalitozoon intestinalis ATCC 50506]|uniref:Very-long-chain (3R)-3-hydroxyacyl-CoA dehydratase n=1 Tax=Encephalitozoon intestinalis (strain ATCC 50506) TaxID=876142 RepID=E0S710_ENCIT|nr:protein tyrosine phosphatase-like protein [Encephalitozoon intestinalis ATCC 50506]ADM11596.1 protein tyrosine phosphatase-like protein [Encephalitozoon intestinalis ATCC 50506]UTX45314.1 protein tyrosine phosphatase-like protein [Encephalitozoon intestinalis]
MVYLSYIRIYNTVGFIICIVALSTSLMFYKTMDPKYLREAGLCQTFFLMEVANICAKKSNARYVPTVMQLVSRMFIIWVVFWYYGIIDWTFPIITTCWYLSDSIRYVFYMFRVDTIRVIRYNLFLLTSPIGFALEMYCLKTLYYSLGKILSYFVVLAGVVYIPGFIFLFSHMLRQRKWSRKVKACKNRKKD